MTTPRAYEEQKLDYGPHAALRSSVAIEISGEYKVENGQITVTAPGGHSLVGRVGENPPELVAKVLLRSIVNQAPTD